MILTIRSCPEPKKFKPFVIAAMEYYAEQLFSKEISKKIKVSVVFADLVDGDATTKAQCLPLNKTEKSIPRDFKITINKNIGSKEIFRTLAHEMVHVKQFALGELATHSNVWKGKFVDVDYFYQPWEVEAYGLEVGLVTNFAKELKLWKVFSDLRNPDSKHNRTKKIAWKNETEV